MTVKVERDGPLTLSSFGDGLNVAVIGASGGIGRALVDDFASCPAVANIFALSRSDRLPPIAKVSWHRLDLEDERSISDAASAVKQSAGRLHIVAVATGILYGGEHLQPEKTWRALNAAAMERAFRLNAIGPALVAKRFDFLVQAPLLLAHHVFGEDFPGLDRADLEAVRGRAAHPHGLGDQAGREAGDGHSAFARRKRELERPCHFGPVGEHGNRFNPALGLEQRGGQAGCRHQRQDQE